MMRRVLTMVLAALLLAGAFSPAALAGEEQTFSATRVYEDQFSDVSATDWYYEHVRALYELGLTNGQGGEDRFDPQGNLTVAEALTMAARLRSLYEYGDSEAGPGQYGGTPWYVPYVSYLQSLGAAGRELEAVCTQAASRAQMAHILANALPASLLEPLNEEVVTAAFANGTYIKDVRRDTPYYADILKLYTWGILSGIDQSGAFHPEETIPRCQTAVMVARLAYRDLRIKLDWDYSSAYSRQGTTMADLIYSDGSFYAAPAADDLEEIDADVRYMLSRGERSLTLSYPAGQLTEKNIQELLNAFLNTVRLFVEQTYNEVQCSYSLRSGTVVLSFSSSLYEDELIDQYREATMAYAIAVHDQLWEEKAITPSMSDQEKARVYFTWICEHCRYDFDAAGTSNNSMSHSGYQVFTDGLAVCDGYTAAYNLLLKLEGISCATVSTPSHIWTIAELDGTSYHIDTTWGDQPSAIAYRFFAMTEADAMARFR